MIYRKSPPTILLISNTCIVWMVRLECTKSESLRVFVQPPTNAPREHPDGHTSHNYYEQRNSSVSIRLPNRLVFYFAVLPLEIFSCDLRVFQFWIISVYHCPGLFVRVIVVGLNGANIRNFVESLKYSEDQPH